MRAVAIFRDRVAGSNRDGIIGVWHTVAVPGAGVVPKAADHRMDVPEEVTIGHRPGRRLPAHRDDDRLIAPGTRHRRVERDLCGREHRDIGGCDAADGDGDRAGVQVCPRHRCARACVPGGG